MRTIISMVMFLIAPSLVAPTSPKLSPKMVEIEEICRLRESLSNRGN